MTEKEKKEINKINEFLYNPENIGNCSECPMNEDFDSWEGKKPCGQQNCWVLIHCNRNN